MSAVQGDVFFIDDYDTLKAVADPLRMQVFELLLHGPQTVRQVADKLGLAPSKLYYHVGLLEKIGLIEVAETRMVANMLEKQYRARADEIEMDRQLLAFRTPEGKENIHAVVVSELDHTREDILRSLQARAFQIEQGQAERPRRMFLNRVVQRISDDQADAFTERLVALLKEFDRFESEAQPPSQTYALTIAFYPSFYYQDGDQPAAAPGETRPAPPSE